ncbi:unnamed protein product [Ambrosiozyma monospora]|uniref:Unnamed protein product n=1 Tax=Ambrosiozyma monospora TaxID=43982 RepID=A0ACB5UB65_AMBMO|nr:unnamed protein product [Ambrosiozyma monospora]
MAPYEQRRPNYHPPRSPKAYPSGPRRRTYYDRDDRDRDIYRGGDRVRTRERDEDADLIYDRFRNGNRNYDRDRNYHRDKRYNRDHGSDDGGDLIYGRKQKGDTEHYRNTYRYRDRSTETNRSSKFGRSDPGYSTITFGTSTSSEFYNFCGTCGFKGHSRTDPSYPKFGLKRRGNAHQDFYCEACGLKGHLRKDYNCPVFALRGPSRERMIDHIHKTDHNRSTANSISFGTNVSSEINTFCGTCGFKGHSRTDPSCPNLNTIELFPTLLVVVPLPQVSLIVTPMGQEI